MSNRMNKNAVFDFFIKELSDKNALITKERKITYQELEEEIARMAAFMNRKNLVFSDSILVYMPNCVEYIIIFFAAVRLGLNMVPANALTGITDLRQILMKTNCKSAFVLEEEKGRLLHSVDRMLPVYEIKSGLIPDLKENEKFLYSSDISRSGVYLSTSGSTGKLKFVSNTYENEIKNALLYTERMNINEEDVIFTGLPFAHKFGLATMLGSLLSGATLLVNAHFCAKEALSFIEKYQVTVQYGVPTIYIKEIEEWYKMNPRPDISSLRTGIIAGASGSMDVFQWFEEYAGCRLLNCYGTSEVGGITMARYDDETSIRHASCGSVFEGAFLEIVDEKGNSLPPNTLGEIVCHSDWRMKEYLRDEELTAKAFDKNDRFVTGDIGKIDEKGNLIFGGRKKDLIIRGGYNIFPAEIEMSLCSFSYISESCVMGYQDPCLGERICAFVSLNKSADISGKMIRDQLKGMLSRYKLPDKIVILQEIPKLPNGKYDYPKLSGSLKKMGSDDPRHKAKKTETKIYNK